MPGSLNEIIAINQMGQIPLPEDIFAEIFMYASLKDLVALQRTCRQFRKIIAQYGKVQLKLKTNIQRYVPYWEQFCIDILFLNKHLDLSKSSYHDKKILDLTFSRDELWYKSALLNEKILVLKNFGVRFEQQAVAKNPVQRSSFYNAEQRAQFRMYYSKYLVNVHGPIARLVFLTTAIGNVSATKYLLSVLKADSNRLLLNDLVAIESAPGNSFITPWHLAAIFGRAEIIHLFLVEGYKTPGPAERDKSALCKHVLNLNHAHDRFFEIASTSYLAAANGHLEVLKTLKHNGKNFTPFLQQFEMLNIPYLMSQIAFDITFNEGAPYVDALNELIKAIESAPLYIVMRQCYRNILTYFEEQIFAAFRKNENLEVLLLCGIVADYTPAIDQSLKRVKQTKIFKPSITKFYVYLAIALKSAKLNSLKKLLAYAEQAEFHLDKALVLQHIWFLDNTEAKKYFLKKIAAEQSHKLICIEVPSITIEQAEALIRVGVELSTSDYNLLARLLHEIIEQDDLFTFEAFRKNFRGFDQLYFINIFLPHYFSQDYSLGKPEFNQILYFFIFDRIMSVQMMEHSTSMPIFSGGYIYEYLSFLPKNPKLTDFLLEKIELAIAQSSYNSLLLMSYMSDFLKEAVKVGSQELVKRIGNYSPPIE